MILSKLIYCISVLPSPHNNMVKEIQNMLYEFIWKGKGERTANWGLQPRRNENARLRAADQSFKNIMVN